MGAVTHVTMKCVVIQRDPVTFQESHNEECPPPSNSPAPSFLWMRADALEKMPQPKKELKSSFYHLSLYFNS